MTAGMIDYGTCALENIENCQDAWIDGIRVIFKKHLIKEPVCIAINYLPDFLKTDYVFITNLNRYLSMASELIVNDDIQITATSNVSSRRMKFDYCIDREQVLEREQEIIDNSFLMFLKV